MARPTPAIESNSPVPFSTGPAPIMSSDTVTDDYDDQVPHTSTADTRLPSQRPNPSHSIVTRLTQSLNDAEISHQSEATTQNHFMSAYDAQSTSRYSGNLPADDGMKSLRAKMHHIRDMALSTEEKARKMHELMVADYESLKALHRRDAQLQSPPNSTEGLSDADVDQGSENASSNLPPAANRLLFRVRPQDTQPTYRPPSPKLEDDGTECLHSNARDLVEQDARSTLRLGCKHYLRNIKIQCPTCSRWHPCRHCHDEIEDHALERKRVQHMLCMLCSHPQPANESCQNCGEPTAAYYCDICKLWDNDGRKDIYHCDDCGICRVGKGLGKDYMHCKVGHTKYYSSRLTSLILMSRRTAM